MTIVLVFLHKGKQLGEFSCPPSCALVMLNKYLSSQTQAISHCTLLPSVHRMHFTMHLEEASAGKKISYLGLYGARAVYLPLLGFWKEEVM